MSTLCAYENYLRDRYVLGQSVHYAAGSNSPKPKSYDREGNEYVWSDEAGDYVRQVGGPGGGRTIRLSEVERTQAEQPQNGSTQAVVATDNDKFHIKPAQFKSSRWFGGKNRTYRVPIDVSRIDSRGKQAIVDTSLNEAVSQLSLIGLQGGDVWHTPRFEFERNIYNTLSRNEELRNILLKKLDTLIDEAVKRNESKTTVGDVSLALAARGLKDIFGKIDQYVPGDYSRRMWPGYDSALKKALSFNGETLGFKPLKTDGGRYFSVAESSIADPFYASFESAEIVLSKKDDNPAPQTEQVNAYSAQHGSKKEAAPQSSVNYSEFADAYKRYRAEGKKVASLKRKASKIQKAVLNPSLSATPEEIKSDKESLAKIRDEISASEQVQRSLTPELAKFVDGNRVVFIDNGDTFVINPSSELVQALGSRIELLDSLKKAQKASKEAKKRGLNGHAGELDSVARKVEDEIARVNNLLSQMFPNETVVSVVDEKPKRRRANKKKESQEERAEENAYRNDASGLGLPGKSDVSLEPDAAGNKDAAYFIRRDLEATPKSEIEEVGEEVDEVSEAPSSEAPQRDDDAALERKIKEALDKGEPLRKKATRLRSKAKDAALKGRKEEAAGLRKQADEIEAEARKHIDEATNAGAELKNRRANASQQPVPKTKESAEKPEVPNTSTPEQQPEPVAEAVQDQPAKPRPERWTPLKSKMNDDDRRVVENTRKRLNFGLADFAWRIANAKEKKDWQKVKELTVLAAQRYLEQARRAYRSHGGADALAAFDETLSGEGLTVGQVRGRVVDKFRQLALMNVADLHKYAGERLDEWEAFSQGAELPSTKDKIALNRLLDKTHYAPNAVPYTPPEKGKIYEVPIDSLNLDPNRFQFKLNTNAQGVTDDLEGTEFDPMQAGIIHVWRDPDDGKDYVVNGHHRFNLAKNSGYDGKVNVRYIDADTADDAKAFGAVANIADSKGTATDVAEVVRTRGSDDIRTPGGKKIATKNKLLADGRVLSKLDETIFRKLKNGSIDEKTARIIAAELPDDKEKQLRLFADIERLGLDASQAQDRAWAYASIQGEKQQGSLFGDDAPMEYDIESRSKLIGEIRKALGGAKRAAQAGGSSRNNEYWRSQKLATNFDRDRAKQLSKSAGQTLDFFKDHIRLTGPMQNIIKEETDEYRKAIKSGKGAEKVVERAIERIKDVAQGGDGSVRRVEGLGLEYEDRLPSAKSEQTRQGVEAKGEREKQKPPRTPSESLRNGTAGEVLETGRSDRPSDGGDGRNLASVIAEEAQKSDIPKNRVREELDAPRQSKTSTPQEEEKPDWLKDLESQEELKPVSKGKYNPEAKPYSWKLKEPETEDDLREFWRKHVDGGLDEDFTLGSDNKKVSIGGVEGDVPMTVDEMRRFMELRLGRENRKALGLSEHFSEEELKALQSPGEKRGRGRISNATHVNKIAQDAQKSEVPQDQVQKKTADAVHGNATARKPQTPSLQEPGGRNAANSQTLSEPKQQDAGAEPLGENVVQDRIAEAVADGDASKRKRNLQRSTKPQEDSLLDNKRKDNISDEEARRRIAKDNLDSFLSAFNSIPKKAPSYWLARKIVNEINDRLSFGGWFAKASIREMLKKLNEDLRMQEYYSVGSSRLDSSAKDLAARLGIERGASHDYFNDLITDLDRAWLQTNPENIGLPSITSYRNGTYISPISPKKKVKRTSNRSSKTFDPDSIKDDVKKAVSIRDADRSQLSGESMESMMSIAKNVYNKHGKDGLKEFMRSIGVVPTAGTRSKLLEELKGELGEVSANRSKGTLIRKMGAEKA
ncbi:MAG: hypothetical protein J6W10_03980 [Kiritimatiellae bacterium]|nr:hypothetical protein [Kiritimatiellia bacterium]